jgi:hypothetical protein
VQRERPEEGTEPVVLRSADPAELPAAAEVPETQRLGEPETVPAPGEFPPRREAQQARAVRPIPVCRTLVRE